MDPTPETGSDEVVTLIVKHRIKSGSEPTTKRGYAA